VFRRANPPQATAFAALTPDKHISLGMGSKDGTERENPGCRFAAIRIRRPRGDWMKRIVLISAAAGLALAAAAGWYWSSRPDPGTSARAQAPAGQARAAPRIPVETIAARSARITADIRAIGGLRSDETVQIAPEIAGRIAALPFAEGREVKQGEIVVKLDDALARAEIDQATARFELGKASLERAERLAKTGAGTAQGRDEAYAEFETARAALELARVRLAKHSIAAPFSGVIGLRTVSPGAYVAIGAGIVNLEKIDSLKVDFKIPEVFLKDVVVGQTVTVTVDALPGETFQGTIYAINPMLDVNGRALDIRARLPNPDRNLRPGLFARIEIRGRTEQEVVLVPEAALVPRGGENFVFRVDGNKAVETKVRLGERRAGEVAILEGLPADATVVTAGQQRLRDGAVVEPVASANPARS
jgi:membrane fusion protein, multidrug efflux system